MGTTNTSSLAALYRSEESFREMYDLQRAYYFNNGLYDEINAQLHLVSLQNESLQPLRNPAYRVVEFYSSTLWPGTLPAALPIETENAALLPVIHQIWAWSNWGAKKQVAVRWLALYGDLFIKVAERPARENGPGGKVYLQIIDPRYVPDFEEDEQGFLVYSDVPQVVRDGDETTEKTFTEEWDKREGTYRTWIHTQAFNTDVDSLPSPETEADIAEQFGVDFVPVVHVKFRHIGEDRGVGCFQPVIDKIDEANRMATRLHGLLFRHNKPDMALEGVGTDAAGRPIPAPAFEDIEVTTELDKETVYKLPSGWKLRHLTANIQYGQALNILKAHMMELERDLPELTYSRLKEQGAALSGRAIRLMLGDAIARLVEVRGNAETGLVRAHQMAITLGQRAGLLGFADVGAYKAGALEHSFAERQVFPLDEQEKADLTATYTAAGFAKATAMRLAGFTQAEIEVVIEEEAAEAERNQGQLALAMLQAQRRFDTGEGEGGA